MRLSGKRAAVTGGNSGIGLAVARALHEEGAELAILGRDDETLAAAAAELGPETVAVEGDVAVPGDLDRFYAGVEAAFGDLDVLVACAGIYEFSPLAATTPEFFDRIVNVNFRGAFFTVQRALGVLKDGASVVFVTSTVQEAGVPGLAVYSATKAALRSLTRSFAAELMSRGIRVNAVSPGIIDTPIFERLGLASAELESLRRRLADQVPMGRMGTPEEVARAVVFLASDEASYLTGCEIPVSGGLGQI